VINAAATSSEAEWTARMGAISGMACVHSASKTGHAYCRIATDVRLCNVTRVTDVAFRIDDGVS
jgi:hypothetical protein